MRDSTYERLTGRGSWVIVWPMTMPAPELSAKPLKTVAYLRVSTEEQARFGWSLEAQRARMQGYAIAYNLEIVEFVVDEGVSGSKPAASRPGFAYALTLLEADRADAMLVASIDRFSRNLKDAIALIDDYFGGSEDGLNKTLLSLSEHIDTSDPDGMFMLHTKLALAQREAKMTSKRTKTTLKHLKESGVKLGAPSMKDLLPKSTLDLILDLRMKQKLSHQKLADTLNSMGIPTASGTPGARWRKNTVQIALELLSDQADARAYEELKAADASSGA